MSRSPWSDRLGDGRLRVQCKTCYDALVPPGRTVRECEVCWRRARQKRAEMTAFLVAVGERTGEAEPPVRVPTGQPAAESLPAFEEAAGFVGWQPASSLPA